jgi:very-short-patch-repair endonuclease
MPRRVIPPLPLDSRDRARELRGVPTDAERELWFHLRAGRLAGLKFRRQHPVPPYVCDFFCDSARLVVELDGSQHSAELDRSRTAFLEAQGLRVLRFWNDEVLKSTTTVLAAILTAAEGRTLTPTPLPRERGSRGDT